MRYEVVRLRPDLREDAAALHATQIGGDTALSARYIEWKYEQSPYFGEPLLYLALAEGKVVGMRGVYASVWRLRDDGRTIVLPCFGGTVVDRAHTSRGVFASIMEQALRDLHARGYPYALNLSATPVTLLNSLATGWRAVGRPTVLHRVPLRWRARERAASVPALRRGYRRVRRTGAGTAGVHVGADPFARFDASTASRGGGIATDVPAPAMEALAAKAAGSHPIQAAYDARYLHWRLADPVTPHRVALSGGARDPAAYLALRGIRGVSRVAVVDWQSRSPDDLRSLLAAVLRAGRWPEVDVWSGSSEPSDLGPFLRAGFHGTPLVHAASLLLRPTAAVPAGGDWRLHGIDLLDEASWRLRLLQSERGLVPRAARSAGSR